LLNNKNYILLTYISRLEIYPVVLTRLTLFCYQVLIR